MTKKMLSSMLSHAFRCRVTHHHGGTTMSWTRRQDIINRILPPRLNVDVQFHRDGDVERMLDRRAGEAHPRTPQA